MQAMIYSQRRLFVFIAVLLGGLGTLAVLLLLAQSPHPVLWLSGNQRRGDPAPAATPQVVATIDEESILLSEWREAMALEWSMSSLLGQMPPEPEEALNRLVNERLVLRAARNAGLSQPAPGQAETWLAQFLEEADQAEPELEAALAQVGLRRADLVDKFIPRLLLVQKALEVLPADGDGEAWVAELRHQAMVKISHDLPLPAFLLTTPPPVPLP